MSLLTEQGCLERRERLWNAVADDVEWLLIADPRYVCYLSGFWVNPLSFSNGERSLLLLKRDGSATLFADNFTRRTAVCDPFVTDEVIEKWYTHKQSVVNRDEALLAAFIDIKRDLDGARGVVEGTALPLRLLPIDVVSLDLGLTLNELRRSKHADEIALLKRCMKAGEAGHARALEVIRPGMTEFELYREVQDAAQEAAGCPCLVYGDFRANNAQTPRLADSQQTTQCRRATCSSSTTRWSSRAIDRTSPTRWP